MTGPVKTDDIREAARIIVRRSTGDVTGAGGVGLPAFPYYGRPSEAERLIELARQNMESGLRALVEDARAGNPHAMKRLKIFGRISDPALATQLALLNHDQRRARLSQLRAEKRRRKARK